MFETTNQTPFQVVPTLDFPSRPQIGRRITGPPGESSENITETILELFPERMRCRVTWESRQWRQPGEKKAMFKRNKMENKARCMEKNMKHIWHTSSALAILPCLRGNTNLDLDTICLNPFIGMLKRRLIRINMRNIICFNGAYPSP